ILEILEKNNVRKDDGVACLIITPTRELVLRKVGKYFEFSAGLIFGGKDLIEESKYIKSINILVATPGRLLQHMDQTLLFDCYNLKILVIDEADKIMELDFADTLNAILENLPSNRQTLFHNEQVHNPIILNAHEDSKFVTPNKLNQFYSVCDLDDKLNFIYSFVKTHFKSKILIFLSCCKQVRYFYKVLCNFIPGTIIMALYGSQKQTRRIESFEKFNNKNNCVLLATDLASRGLDFPDVDWVIQGDCSSDVQTYIHRVGRTARFNNTGNSLLVLLPSELEFLKLLQTENIPIEHIYVKPDRKINIVEKLSSFCAKEIENKMFAQQCFVSYLKSVYLQKHKHIFDIHKLPILKFSRSLGLISAPELRFIKGADNKKTIQNKSAESDENCDILHPIDSPTELPIPMSKPIKNIVKTVSKAKLAKTSIKKSLKVNKK
ncbi:LOW QUALITY PROTEIN: hypothetical protein MXB_5566, partial [Myxobolus squamalis]